MTASLNKSKRSNRVPWNKAIKILELLKMAPDEQVQAMLESGLLADIRDANYSRVDAKVRDEIRKLLDLTPLLPQPQTQQIVDDISRLEVEKWHSLRVPVDESRDWIEAMESAGQCILDDEKIEEIAGQFPSKKGAGKAYQEVTLVLFKEAGRVTLNEVRLWGERRGWRVASSRTIFAVSEFFPFWHDGVCGIEPGERLHLLSFERCVFNHHAAVPIVTFWDDEDDDCVFSRETDENKELYGRNYCTQCSFHDYNEKLDDNCWVVFVHIENAKGPHLP